MRLLIYDTEMSTKRLSPQGHNECSQPNPWNLQCETLQPRRVIRLQPGGDGLLAIGAGRIVTS